MGVGDVKQLRVAVGVSFDQLANVGIARGDGASERRTDGFVGFQCQKTCVIGLGCLRIGFGRGGIR